MSDENQRDLNAAALDAFIFSLIKSFSIIVWYFLSNYFIKQRKVTTVFKIMKWFYGVYFVWIAFYAAQIFFSWKYVDILLTDIQSAYPMNTEDAKENDW